MKFFEGIQFVSGKRRERYWYWFNMGIYFEKELNLLNFYFRKCDINNEKNSLVNDIVSVGMDGYCYLFMVLQEVQNNVMFLVVEDLYVLQILKEQN